MNTRGVEPCPWQDQVRETTASEGSIDALVNVDANNAFCQISAGPKGIPEDTKRFERISQRLDFESFST